MMWFFLACTAPNEKLDATAPMVSGAVEMNMVVSSAINGEYEPCG